MNFMHVPTSFFCIPKTTKDSHLFIEDYFGLSEDDLRNSTLSEHILNFP